MKMWILNFRRHYVSLFWLISQFSPCSCLLKAHNTGIYSLQFTQLPPHPKQRIKCVNNMYNSTNCNKKSSSYCSFMSFCKLFCLFILTQPWLPLRYRFLLLRKWVNLRTVPLWSIMTSNLWITWKCVPATLQCSAALRMMVLALKSWTHFSLSWKRSFPLPAGVSEHWRNRDRWKNIAWILVSPTHSHTVAWLKIFVFLLSEIDTNRLAGQKRGQKVPEIRERNRSFSLFSPFQTQKTEGWWER